MTQENVKLALPEISLDQLDVNVPGLIIIFLNYEGVVIEINQTGCDILGRSKDEIVGKSWFRYFLPRKVRNERQTNFYNMIEGKSHLEYYAGPILSAEGEKFIAWHGMLIHEKRGQVVGVLFSGKDITEQRRAEEELKKYLQRLEETVAERSSDFAQKNNDLELANAERQNMEAELKLKSIMLEKAPESIMMADFQGNIIYMNETGQMVFEFGRNALTGITSGESGISQIRALINSVSYRLRGEVQFKHEFSFTRRDGSAVPMQVHSRVVATPYGDRILSIFRESTT